MSARVLMVEDEAIIAMNLHRTLTRLGYEATHAFTGEEAIERAREIQPNLVLMNIMLTGEMDGIEAAERLHADMGLPIVYLTGYSDHETLERAKRAEPMAYLLKPFRERELRSTLEIALSRYETEKRLLEGQTLYRMTLESIQDAVIIVGSDQKITYVNRVARDLLDADCKEPVGRDISVVFNKLDEPQRLTITNAVSGVLREGGEVPLGGEAITFSGRGRATYLAQSVSRLQDEKGCTTGALLVFRQIGGHSLATELSGSAVPPHQRAQGGCDPPPGRTAEQGRPCIEESSIKIPDTTSLDTLTGLPARKKAEAVITDAIRHGRDAHVVVFVLDRYALITRRFGRAATDELLQLYGIHLAQGLAATDELFRWTGPSFVALLERPGSQEDIRRELARLGSVRLERVLRLYDRAALVLVSASWTVFRVQDYNSPELCSQQIDSFVVSKVES